MTSPRIEELPEEVVETVAKTLFDHVREGTRLHPADRKRLERTARANAELALQAALSTGRLMLVPEESVPWCPTREQAAALVEYTDLTGKTHFPVELTTARAQLSQALAQVEADER